MKKIEGDFEFLCQYKEIRENTGYRFFVKDTDIALFKVKGKFYALSNVCPHQHAAIIYDGFLEDGKIVCPAHGWSFDLETGNLEGGGRGLESFELKILGGNIYIKIDEKPDLF